MKSIPVATVPEHTILSETCGNKANNNNDQQHELTSIHELQTLQCEQRGGRYMRHVVHHFMRIVIPLISTFLNNGAARPFSAFISSSEAAMQWQDQFTDYSLQYINK